MKPFCRHIAGLLPRILAAAHDRLLQIVLNTMAKNAARKVART